ncbi:hypothetical protein ABPG74_009039 [Tetrahymena malaccensis]
MKKEVKKKIKKYFKEDGGDKVGGNKQQLTHEEQEELDQCNLTERQNSASKDHNQNLDDEVEQKEQETQHKSANNLANNFANTSSSASNSNQKEHQPAAANNKQLINQESLKSEEEEGGKIDDDHQNKEDNEEPEIDVEEIRNKLRKTDLKNQGDQSSSSEDDEDEEQNIQELRERVVTISQFESKQGIQKLKKQIASESSEQENYYRLFQKPEQETENQQENDDNDDQEEISDVSPKQDYDLEEEDDFEDEQANNSQPKQPNKSPQQSPYKEDSFHKQKIVQLTKIPSKNHSEETQLEHMNSTVGTSIELSTQDQQIEQLLQGNQRSRSESKTYHKIQDDSSNNVFGEDGQVEKKKKKKKFKWETYKRMLKYSRKQWKLSLLGHIFLVAQSVSQVFIPSVSGRLLDATIKERDLDKLNQLAFQAILIFLANGVSSFFRTFIFSLIGERVVIDLRNDCFSKFIHNEISFHDKQHSGELISRLGNDISTAKAAASGNISTTIRNVIICIGNVIMLFLISRSLFVVIAIMIPIFVITSSVYGRYLKKLTKKYQDYTAKVSSHAQECFSNIKTVKAFSNEDKEILRYNEVMKQCYEVGYNKSVSSGLYNGINSLVSDFATLAVLWYGGYLVLQENDLTSGQLASVILYTGSLASATSSISSSLSKIVTATGASDRLFKLMDKKPKIKCQGGKTYFNFRGEISFQNVGFSYKHTDHVKVLSEFNLDIKPGERVALVGESGSGKSTVIRLIERFYDVTQGQITIDGYNIKEIDLNFLHSYIGYVSQEPLLFSGTIEENITYGLKKPYSRELLDQVCKLANSYNFIHDKTHFPLGYKTLVGEAGAKLSGGQKQRIAISRALILQPKILIFDEATSALDAESEFQVQQAIDELMQKQKDMTIILIAHRLSTIMNCEKIVVIKKGKVAEIGNHKELIERNGIYKQLVDRQLQGFTNQ